MANDKDTLTALFCRSRNIDLECDGDTYHCKTPDVKRDKKRNNLHENRGWAVLRYTTEEIRQDLPGCMFQIKEAVNRYGDIEDPAAPGRFRVFGDQRRQQLERFI